MIVIDELKFLFSLFIKIFKTFILIFYYIFERMLENTGDMKLVVNTILDKGIDFSSEIINLFKV